MKILDSSLTDVLIRDACDSVVTSVEMTSDNISEVISVSEDCDSVIPYYESAILNEACDSVTCSRDNNSSKAEYDSMTLTVVCDSVQDREDCDSVTVVCDSVHDVNNDSRDRDFMRLHNIVSKTGVYNFQDARVTIPSGINIEFWKESLIGYKDDRIVQYLQFGWPINYCGDKIPSSVAKNHPTAEEFPEAVENYIQIELKHGALIGPLKEIPFCQAVISPLHSVPKSKHNTAQRRIVLDLSFPPGASVNDGIPKESYLGEDVTLEYPSVDKLAEMLVDCVKKGGKPWMLKRDLSRAYRQLRVDPSDYKYLGFKWNGYYYFDVAPTFGLRTAAQMCQRSTDALAFIALKHHNLQIVNYVDDIALVAEDKQSAIEAGATIDKMITDSGLVLAHHKSVEATQQMTFLGVLFNSDRLTMEVTKDRLDELDSELSLWLQKKKATKQEIQSLAGKLQFVAKCCKPGRCFMARILSTLKKLKRATHYAHLGVEFRKDIRWWYNFLPHFHRTSVIKVADWEQVDSVVATDACLQGAGGTFENRYFKYTFPEELKGLVGGINQLEAVGIIIALKLWGQFLKGRKLVVKCDNFTTVSVVNKGRAKEKFLQCCAREITFLACVHQFEIRAIHIPGVTNILPDKLSRAAIDNKYYLQFLESVDSTWHEDIVPVGSWKFTCQW